MTLYRHRRRLGLCPECPERKKKKPRKGSVACAFHTKFRAAKQKEYRERKSAEGECIMGGCWLPAKEGHTRCEGHLARLRKGGVREAMEKGRGRPLFDPDLEYMEMLREKVFGASSMKGG